MHMDENRANFHMFPYGWCSRCQSSSKDVRVSLHRRASNTTVFVLGIRAYIYEIANSFLKVCVLSYCIQCIRFD